MFPDREEVMAMNWSGKGKPKIVKIAACKYCSCLYIMEDK